MAGPLRIAYPRAFYHVTSRGNERKDIFKSQRGREKFLSYRKQVVRCIAMKIGQDNKPREKSRKIENKLRLSRMKT